MSMDGFAVIISPLGYTGCDIGKTYAGCGSLKGLADGAFPTGSTGDRKWWIDLNSKGAPNLDVMNGSPEFADGSAVPEKVPYGQVVYYANVACGFAKTGMTCWNLKTGHGAFMNKSKVLSF